MYLASSRGLDDRHPPADAEGVIPTLILVGLIFGRWWKIVVPAAIIGWPILLIVTGVDSGWAFAASAALFAAANVSVGVLAFVTLRLVVRRLAAPARRATGQR
jgi:hypothetical protein